MVRWPTSDNAGAGRETDREIVDTQRDPGDEQPSELLLIRGRVREPGSLRPQSLDESVHSGGDEQASADPAGGVPKSAGQAAPER
jgi:hypothetical protein